MTVVSCHTMPDVINIFVQFITYQNKLLGFGTDTVL